MALFWKYLNIFKYGWKIPPLWTTICLEPIGNDSDQSYIKTPLYFNN